ncbi:oligosaccharide flippase family protein [Bradyrhizobium guangdongense]
MFQHSAITKPAIPLRKRILKAGAWTLASYLVEVASRFISNLLITRLLFPEAFGLMAAATALIVSLALISDVGVRAFVIQSERGEDTSFLHSAWTFQCVRGTTLWLVISTAGSLLFVPEIRSALPQNTVFANPLFPSILIGLGLTLFFNGLESTATALNMRRLNFRPIVVLDVSARVVSLAVTIAAAYLSRSVWSLVFGSLSGAISRVLLSHLIVPGPKMRPSFNREQFRDIIAFGRWINVSSIATFVVAQSDMLILGLLIPAPTLGIYYIAKSLTDAVEVFLERLNSTLTLPVLSEILRRNPSAFTQQYYQFRMPLEMIAFAAAGFLFAAGEWIINFLYDPRYASAGMFLRALSFGLLLYPFQFLRGAFTASGRPEIVAFSSLIHAFSLMICLSGGYYFWGPIGAVAGIVSSRLFPSLLLMGCGYKASWVSVSREVRFIPMFLIGALIGHLLASMLSSFRLSDLTHLLR